MTPPNPAPPQAQARVLQTLRIALHVMFAFLLLFGLARYLWGADSTPGAAPAACAVAAVVLMGVVYLVGTVWENWYARALRGGRANREGKRLDRAGRAPVNPRRWAPLWIGLVGALWIALLLISADFVWVAFPLMFVVLHLLGRGPGLAGVAIIWLAAVFFPWWDLAREGHPERFSIGSAIGPLLGAVLAVIISSAYRALHDEAVHHLRVAEQLRATRAELAEREHQAGRLEERERLAREIHDTVAQGLSSIVLMSRAASGSLAEGRPAEARDRLGTIQTTAEQNLGEARRFVRDLSSPELDQALVPSLRAVAERTQNQAAAAGRALRCEVRCEEHGREGGADRLPEPVSAALLRAAQASLSNVAEHAEASIAVVTLEVWDTEATLDVFDDGRGFDPSRFLNGPTRSGAGREGGYGLAGLRARLAVLGGSLTVDSTPGEGTAVGVRIPLTSAHGPEGDEAENPATESGESLSRGPEFEDPEGEDLR